MVATGQTYAMSAETSADSGLEFTGPILYWRGPSPYFFLRVPADESEDLLELGAEVSYGWGMIPVEVTLQGLTWETSLWPKDGGYLVPIRAHVRKKLAIDADDVVTLQLTVAQRHGRAVNPEPKD